MSLPREANAEPIPGYRLIEPLGSGGFGEVWKCEAPGGLFKAIKYIHGNLNGLDGESIRAAQEWNALQRVKEVRHPFILSIERIEQIRGEVVIVMELADKNLHDLLVEHQAKGHPGIPRGELLAYLMDAAEALDWMNVQQNLQHLDIKPRNLFWVGHHVKVGDFGLVKDLEGRSGGANGGGPIGGVTPLYAAPETFNGIISRHSDQYSLAIVYQELLTGTRPFMGKSPRELMKLHTKDEPDLKPLPEVDRVAASKALNKKPQERFPSCRAFVEALRSGQLQMPRSMDQLSIGSSTAAWRAWSMPATLEELVLSPADPVRVLDQFNENGSGSDPQLSPEDMTRVSVTVAQPASGSLKPTLIIGLGTFGRQAVQALRCRIIDRFGNAAKLPILRYLVVDTDQQALRHAMMGAPEQALSTAELHELPLHRVGDYRRNIRDFELAQEWMPQDKWYAAPRSCEAGGTRGSRALGRLAFFYNHNRLLARLRNELKHIADPKHLDLAVSQTGLALRSETPQVYIVTSACGGTGSGMLLDLSYTLRRLLQELGYHQAEVNAWLMGGAPNDPVTPPEERANFYATLTEINHFSDPAVEFTAQYASTAMPVRDASQPFNAAYVVKMGHRSPDGLKETAAKIAGYLFHDLTTPVGSRLAQSRATQFMGKGSPFRSFGTYTIWFPRGLLLRVAARGACQRLIEDWQTPLSDADWHQDVGNTCDRLLGDPRWKPDAIRRRIEDTAASAAENPVGQELTAYFSNLETQCTLNLANEDPAGWCQEAYKKVSEMVGSGVSAMEQTSEWRKSRVHRLFAKSVDKVADEYLNNLMIPARDMFDTPGYRLAAAEAAYNHLHQRCCERFEEQQDIIDEQKRTTEKCWLYVEQAMDACLRSSSSFLFGRSLRKPLRQFVERLANYARQRIAEEICRSIQQFFKVLQGSLEDLQRDLILCRNRLRDLQQAMGSDTNVDDPHISSNGVEKERHAMALAQSYSSALLRDATIVLASRIVLPDGATDLDQAADDFLARITKNEWVQLDQFLQEQVLHKLGGLRQTCMTSSDLTRALGTPLLEKASEYLGQHLPITDVCEAEYSAAEKLEIDLPSQLKAYYHLATPSLGSQEPDRESGFLLLPNSDAGRNLGKIARETLDQLQVVQVANTTDFLFCREQADISLADLQDMLGPCKLAYEEAASTPKDTPHSRYDILQWIPLEV